MLLTVLCSLVELINLHSRGDLSVTDVAGVAYTWAETCSWALDGSEDQCPHSLSDIGSDIPKLCISDLLGMHAVVCDFVHACCSILTILAAFGSTDILSISLAVASVTLMQLRLPERTCGNESINTCPPYIVTRTISSSSFFTSTTASQRVAAAYHPSFNASTLQSFMRRPCIVFYPLSCEKSPHPSRPTLSRSNQIASLSPSTNTVSSSNDCCETCLAIPPWRTFDDLDGVLTLAEAWEMVVQYVSFAHPSLRLHFIPTRTAPGGAIQTTFGWEVEADRSAPWAYLSTRNSIRRRCKGSRRARR